MAIKIKRTSDVKVNGVKAVIFGSAGVGKTVLCSTAPNPLIISAENGLLSIADKDIPFIEVSNVTDIEEAYEYAKKSDFETICIDSLSEVGEVTLAELKKDEKDGRQAYMKLATAANAFLRNFRDLDHKNVVFITKLRRIENESTGIIEHVPSMPGRVIPDNLPYLVDLVLPMRIGKHQGKQFRYLQTQPDIQWIAKDRSGKLKEKEPPNLTDIFKKVKGED